MSSTTSALAAGTIPAREKFRRAAVEPLLPTEKKLIGWSLGVGVTLLVVVAVVNRLFLVAI